MRETLTLTTLIAALLLAGCATRPGRLVVPGYHRVGACVLRRRRHLLVLPHCGVKYTLHERATVIPYPHCGAGYYVLLGIHYRSAHPPHERARALPHAWRITNAPGGTAHEYCVREGG